MYVDCCKTNSIVLLYQFYCVKTLAKPCFYKRVENRNFHIFTHLTEKYFDEINQDTGRYCFGIKDTLHALELGAVETLIVWENLEITRYVMINHTTSGKWAFV